MKNTFSIFNIIKFSFHFILTFIVFYYSYLLALKFILIINSNENLLLTILYSLIILGIINYVFLKFIVMTIIAGIFNCFDFEKINKIKYITYISCVISALLLFEKKKELFQVYQNKEVIFIYYTLIVFSTLKFIFEVNKETLNLKLNADYYSELIEIKKSISYWEAFELIEKNSFIPIIKKIEIRTILENKYKLLSDIEKERDKNLYVSKSMNKFISSIKPRSR
jgi:hypothetical protein